MKIKFFAIYIAAGVAFLAASLWVFLSNGKSARALRTKYKMGGLMLTATSMLAASACQCSPVVTCYEPAEPPEVMCYDVVMEPEGGSGEGGSPEGNSGEDAQAEGGSQNDKQ